MVVGEVDVHGSDYRFTVIEEQTRLLSLSLVISTVDQVLSKLKYMVSLYIYICAIGIYSEPERSSIYPFIVI